MEVDVAGFGRNAAGRYAGDEAADGRNPYNLRRSRAAGISCAAVARARPADLDYCSAAGGVDSGRLREAIAALSWCGARPRDFRTNVVGRFFSQDCYFTSYGRGHRHL